MGRRLEEYVFACAIKSEEVCLCRLGTLRCKEILFRETSVDCTTAVRLMRHLPRRIRITILSELGRVTRGTIVASCNNQLSALGRQEG